MNENFKLCETIENLAFGLKKIRALASMYEGSYFEDTMTVINDPWWSKTLDEMTLNFHTLFNLICDVQEEAEKADTEQAETVKH